LKVANQAPSKMGSDDAILKQQTHRGAIEKMARNAAARLRRCPWHVVAQGEFFGLEFGAILSAAVLEAERRISHWP
jgi:hypothetical protein